VKAPNSGGVRIGKWSLSTAKASEVESVPINEYGIVARSEIDGGIARHRESGELSGLTV
jgi:hypothetical protein